MTAFARALAALHRDVNLAVDCTWTAGPDRTAAGPLAIRGIRGQAQEPTFGTGTLGAVTPRERLDLAAADLPVDVMRGDVIGIGADTFSVEMAELDPEGVTWRLTLSEP